MRAVTVQRLLGHKDVSVTLNTYTTIFDKYKEQEIEKVNGYYMNNYIIQPTQQFLEKNNTTNEEKIVLNENNDTANKQQVYSEKDNYIMSKKMKKINELYLMIGKEVSKGTISLSEYLENLEYLQKMEQRICEEEEKGEIKDE